MMRRRGFTLIELLVVIAIIAILAAMLFPVFARARESARKTQCLSNIKNIATSVQMYLSDYGRFPSGDHDAGAHVFFDTAPGGDGDEGEYCWKQKSANPYLRWPVILEEYTKNRDIWRCPSSQTPWYPDWIIPQYNKVWWQYIADNVGKWGRANSDCNGHAGGPCCVAWPPGWGGTVTDSIAQQMIGSYVKTGVPEISEGVNDGLEDAKESQLGDPSWTVVAGDAQNYGSADGVNNIMYSLCGIDCGAGDWDNCPDTQTCRLDHNLVDVWPNDAQLRRKYTRHLGGSNVGFADGHASWFDESAFRAAAATCIINCDAGTCTYDAKGKPLRGLCPPGI